MVVLWYYQYVAKYPFKISGYHIYGLNMSYAFIFFVYLFSVCFLLLFIIINFFFCATAVFFFKETSN